MSEKFEGVPHYPTVRFLVRWGGAVTVILTGAPVLAGLLVLIADGGWLWLAAAVILAPVIFLILSSYMELIRIIGDTLLPR